MNTAMYYAQLAALMLGSERDAHDPNQDPNASEFGSDFGNDYGADYGAEFGLGSPFERGSGSATAAPMTGMQLAARGGMQMANTSGASRVPQFATDPRLTPPPAVAAALWQAHSEDAARTHQRNRILEPNKGSSVKVERYAFAINQTLALGTAVAINATGNPDCTIRPQRITMNAPTYGFITVAELKVANVSVSVGGVQDAFDYNANGVGQTLDLPTLSPANRATVLGNYTGFVPPGFAGGQAYTFCVGFKGPASMVA